MIVGQTTQIKSQKAVSRIHDIFGVDPDPAILVIDLQDANKKLI
jgi:hypothetical protein